MSKSISPGVVLPWFLSSVIGLWVEQRLEIGLLPGDGTNPTDAALRPDRHVLAARISRTRYGSGTRTDSGCHGSLYSRRSGGSSLFSYEMPLSDVSMTK